MPLMKCYGSFTVPSSLSDLVSLGGRVTLDEKFVVDSGSKSLAIVVGLLVVNRISWRGFSVVV